MIHVILGTKAQLIKMAPVMLRLQEKEIPYNFILTGQHRETMPELRENFSLKSPDVILHSGSEIVSVSSMLAWLLKLSMKTLLCKKDIFKGERGENAIVLIHGDTFSTLLGAVMGRIAGIRVAHVESGLRSFDLWNPFPEELTRVMTFYLSDICFCPGQWAVENLKRFRGIKINTNHNTLIDALDRALQAIPSNAIIPPKPYCIVSIHRFENLCSRFALERAVSLVEMIARNIRVVFILHPVTDRRLVHFNLKERLEGNSSIELHPRYDYFTFIHLLNGSAFMVSDGGSNQEESFYLGKPCLLLRTVTERIEGMKGNVVISHYDKGKIIDFVRNYIQYQTRPVRGSVSPADIIVASLTGERPLPTRRL